MPDQGADSDVSVIGLGPMGVAIARTFIARGRRVTVWNRSADKAGELAAAGASLASTPGDAFAASPLVLLVLANTSAVSDVLTRAGGAVADRTIVNLGAAPPAEAEALGKRVTAAGGRYITGSIMAYPRQIGLDAATIFYSGPKEALEAHRTTLALLAGRTNNVGVGWGQAKRVSWPLYVQSFSALSGFFEGASLARRSGLSGSDYADWVVTTVLPFYASLIADAGRRLDQQDFDGGQATLDVEAHAIDGLVALLRSHEIQSLTMGAFQSYLAQAKAAGHGGSSLAVVGHLIDQGRSD